MYYFSDNTPANNENEIKCTCISTGFLFISKNISDDLFQSVQTQQSLAWKTLQLPMNKLQLRLWLIRAAQPQTEGYTFRGEN